MTKEEFEIKMKLVRTFLDENLKGADGIGYVLLMNAVDKPKGQCYSDMISNVAQHHVKKFVDDMMKVVVRIMGRNN